MIILGIVLIIVGWWIGLSILELLGLILVIVGLFFMFVPIRGERRRYW
jgi:hypothetical protein